MTRRAETLRPEYFEALYSADPDPWRFASSDYEREKYSATLSALPKPRYDRGLEVGCSIGVLTAQLAPRCAHLLAVDAAAAPLETARRRCAAFPSVAFEQVFAPRQWPSGIYDLVLLSEVVYYLCAEDVRALAARVVESTASGADILLVHWTGETDYPLTGDGAAELFIADVGDHCRVEGTVRHLNFRLDLLSRR